MAVRLGPGRGEVREEGWGQLVTWWATVDLGVMTHREVVSRAEMCLT